MEAAAANVCAICGEERSNRDRWFLIAENRWEDKLKILRWDDRLAQIETVQIACSAEHVKELVVHWMTTGRLGYPFARTLFGAASRNRGRVASPVAGSVDTSSARGIGELAVHRESLERLLGENPQSLKVILDALLCALEREATGPEAHVEPKVVETPFATPADPL